MDNYNRKMVYVKNQLTKIGKYGTNRVEIRTEGNVMTGEMRRDQLLRLLKESAEPVCGTALAKKFQVSRQVIVQDIALMRAERHPVLSTNKGYLYRSEDQTDHQPKRVFCLQHRDDQVLEEFRAILELGGRILDVAVEHELYGQIRMDLLIETDQDAQNFVARADACGNRPLMTLTCGCHYHTVAAPSEKLLDLIEAELQKKGFLQPIGD
jgi:transcriptional regulator of NAD metabolism